MEDKQTQASIAASLLAKRKHEIAKQSLGPKAYSEAMREMARRPRPNRRKKNPQVKN